MGTMPIIVLYIGIIRDIIPTMYNIIGLAVAIGIGISLPQMVLQVIMFIIDTRVQYCDNDILACISLFPNLRSIYLRDMGIGRFTANSCNSLWHIIFDCIAQHLYLFVQTNHCHISTIGYFNYNISIGTTHDTIGNP